MRQRHPIYSPILSLAIAKSDPPTAGEILIASCASVSSSGLKANARLPGVRDRRRAIPNLQTALAWQENAEGTTGVTARGEEKREEECRSKETEKERDERRATRSSRREWCGA